MTRVQILLPEDQDRRLEELARKRRESKASVVREALERLFQAESREPDPLVELIGQAGRAGIRNGARLHDRLLAAAEQRRNRKR
jgi:predicted transcriptional regulator